MTRTRPNFAPTALAIAISLISANLHAADLPTGGNIVGGSGSISQDGNSLNVQQNSDKLITNWDSFDIGAGNTVNFYQPGSNSVALNRVIGEDASAIYGNLNANGKVFLVNPNGVLFGEGAAVNVGALVASTLSLSDQDFNDGNYQFQGDGNNAAVINRGSITADGGAVALLGGQVSNHGIIQANQGTVALAAGDKITLDFAGDGLLNVAVDEGTLNALVENHQLVRANGGQVVMTANATNALLQTVVNNTGIIEAQTLENQSGTIVLKGGFNGGTVNVAGTLDASAPDSGDGGFIDTSGAHVKIAGGTQVTTKANNGSTGEWLIDPTDFTVNAGSDALTDSGIGAATLSANLENNNVTLATVDGGTEAGDMYVNGAVSWNADHTLSLNAHNNIHINEAITATNGGLTLNAGGNISADGAVNVGTFNLQSGAWSQLVSNLADFSARDFRLNTANARFLRANGGDGSEGNAYQIVDLYGLQGMASRSLLSSHFALTNDIDASGTTNWNGGAGFVPIGNGTNNYTGSFDGQGHSINGLTINRRRTNEVGLFGVISASQISNIGLTNATITGQSRVGGLVGQGLNNSRISYSSVQGDISAYLNGGGLTGNFAGTIEHSHSAGAVYATEVSGGLVGWLVGQISDSYSTASVKGDFGGGLVGIMNGGQISRSYATGQVKEYIFGSIGGLIGSMLSGTITNSYWNTDTSGQASAVGGGSSAGTTGLTTAQMFDAANFTGFDFAGTWANANNQTTPYLRALAGNRVFNKNDLPTGTIDATNRPALYTVIQNVEQLQAMRDDVTANYLLGNHIDASATAGWNGGAGFVPVGDGANRYAGSFDGLGHTLSNLTIDRSSTDFVGLFGATASGSMIRDIGLVGGSVSGRNHVGGLVGVSSGTISNAYATVSVEGSGRVGGLVGFNQSGTLNDAYATGDVEGSSEDVGGLVGLNQSGTISNVYATGSVKGADRVGGLAGANQSGTISDAYATGSVSGREYVGGLAGYNYSTISNAYATGSIEGITFVGGLLGYNTGTINNLYATGSVKGSSFSIGGLVGYNYLATISNAYATGSVKGGDLVGGLVGSNGGTISNAYATGSVKGKNAVGGLVGYTSSGTISNAYATGSVEGSETSTGGLVGSNGGTISNAYATGSVKGSDAYVGGLVGFNRSGTINDAYATGSVSATDSAGGLVGYSFDSSTITNSYWNIDTSGKANAVGLNNSGSTNGITGLTTAQMLQADSFTGWDIDAQGGTGTVWRIYEGYTAPLLRNFLTALEVTCDTTTTTYNGTEQTGGWSTTGEYDADRIFGQASGGGRNAGTYNIDMSGLYSDQQGYDLITTNGTLTINKAQATVTANSGTTTYNGAEQSVDGFTVDGLVNGENASVLTGVTTSGGKGTNAGSYALTASGSDGNYELSFVDGALTINKAQATVTANSGTTSYNGTEQSVDGFTVDGLVNGEDQSVLTGVTTSGGKGTNAGSYKLTASGSDGNYELSFVDGKLTINKAQATVTANSGTTTYNGTEQSVEGFTVDGLVNGEDQSVLTGVTTSGGKGTNAGTYTLTASGADGNYELTFVDGKLTINKAQATVTANSGTTTYNGTEQSVSGFTVDGLVNGENASVLSGVTTSGGKGTNAGSYTLTASGSDGNYELSFVDGKLTINKAQATVTANSATTTYNGTEQSVSGFTVDGLVNGEDASVLTGVTTNGGKGTNAGSYTLTASGADGNYELTFVDGKLTINKAQATVTANSGTTTYNGTEQSVSGFTVDGLVNGEDQSVLAGVTTSGGKGTNAGSYALTVSGTDGNYELTFVDGTLTIERKAITGNITADGKTYDGNTYANTHGTLDGVISGDDLQFNTTGAFADKYAGTGKQVTVSGSIVGDDAGNYVLTTNSSTTANIDRKTITADIRALDKLFDGSLAVTLKGMLSGTISGDDVALQLSGLFASLTPGENRVLVDASLSGTDAGNYQLLAPDSVPANMQGFVESPAYQSAIVSQPPQPRQLQTPADPDGLLTIEQDPLGLADSGR